RIVERAVALVPEGRRLFARMTVRENLELDAFTQRAQTKRQDQIERVHAFFPRLFERERQLAGSLSGGEQQMLALARALMGLPRLLLLDEPSLGLAPRVVESIFSILAELHREGMSLLIVEQNVQTVLNAAQRAYILEGGKIVGEGEGQRLLQDDHVRAAYLGPLARGGSSFKTFVSFVVQILSPRRARSAQSLGRAKRQGTKIRNPNIEIRNRVFARVILNSNFEARNPKPFGV
ncbi:MAG: ATP-binding cassette domain-containing protein, partial [Deltaproteobacteria bacterium]